MGSSIARRIPNTRNTERTAATLFVVVRAVHFAPRMRTPDLNSPSVFLGVSECCFDFLFRVAFPCHCKSVDLDTRQDRIGCQLTTCLCKTLDNPVYLVRARNQLAATPLSGTIDQVHFSITWLLGLPGFDAAGDGPDKLDLAGGAHD